MKTYLITYNCGAIFRTQMPSETKFVEAENDWDLVYGVMELFGYSDVEECLEYFDENDIDLDKGPFNALEEFLDEIDYTGDILVESIIEVKSQETVYSF